MFDMGIWEITLIFVLLLVIVGPERLPKLARTVGLWVGKARSIVASVKAEVEQELKVEDLKRSIAQQTDVEEFKRLANQVKSINSDINSDINSVGADIRKSTEKSLSSQSLSSTTPPKPVPSEDSAHVTNDQAESSLTLTKKASSSPQSSEK